MNTQELELLENENHSIHKYNNEENSSLPIVNRSSVLDEVLNQKCKNMNSLINLE
jgi:hypothetical protein